MDNYGKNQQDITALFAKAEKIRQEQESGSEEELLTASVPEEVEVVEKETTEVAAFIGLNGIKVSEEGEVSRHNYFALLQVDEEKYSDVKFTEEEAKRVSMSIRRMSTGINSSIPMTCTGVQCPFASTCPYVAENKAPLARPCLVEAQLIQYWNEQFIEEFDVDIANITELHLVSELAECNIYEMRVTKHLADKDPTLLTEVVTTVDHAGEEITNIDISKAFDLKDRIKNRRMKILEALMATRKERVKLRLDMGGGHSAADKVSDLKNKLDELRKDIGNMKPIEGNVLDDQIKEKT